MGDYADYFIDGIGCDPGDTCAPRTRQLPAGRASVSVTMTKAQKRKYLELGGAVWLKKTLTDAIKAAPGLACVNGESK